MNIFIPYLDTKKATIAVLRDYHDQHWKLEQGKRKLTEIDRRLAGKISNLGTEPVSGGGGNKTEDQWCVGIDQKIAAEEGYNKAYEYCYGLHEIWNRLEKEEYNMLIARFVDLDENSGMLKIMHKYSIGKSEAYNRSNAALTHLSKLLFW